MDDSQSAHNSQSADNSRSADNSQSANNSQSADNSRSADNSQSANNSQSADNSRSADNSQSADNSRTTEVGKTEDGSETEVESQTVNNRKTVNDICTTEVSKKVDNSQTVDDSETADDSEKVKNKKIKECDDSDWYPATFFQRLNEFRLEGHLIDVTLCAEGKEIPCHRLVLSAFTDYFHAMFNGFHRESKIDKIEVKGIEAEILQQLVDYAYTSKITITPDNIVSLYAAANMLQIKAVEDSCVEYLSNLLNSAGMCMVTWMLAERMSSKRLLGEAKCYPLKHLEEVCMDEDFVVLPAADIMKAYFSDDSLHARKEEEVLEAIMRWVKHDLKHRQRHLKSLLECVRFSYVDQDYLKDILEKDETLSSVPGIKDLIQDQSTRDRPRLIHQEEILVLGGTTVTPLVDNNNVYRFALNGDCVDTSPLPEFLCHGRLSSACVVNNDVFVTSSGLGSYSVCEAWRYKPYVGSWTQLGPLVKKQRNMNGMAALEGRVYVVGGIVNVPFGQDRMVFEAEVYDEGTNSWKLVAPLQKGVRNFGIAACCKKIFVFGGKTGECTFRDNSYNTDAVQCYDPAQDVWTLVQPLPNPLDGIMACTVNSKIYMVGGELEYVLGYGPEEDLYYKMVESLFPWFYCGATVVGSEIYITGGLERKDTFDDLHGVDTVEVVSHAGVQCFNPGSNIMVPLRKELPHPLSDHIAVTIPKPKAGK
ncbi:kelch-like protein 24 [Branchiostoma floridae]|uniref:Kelch-like protein 24 n=2 Tax=Branchiostoma floridae TaxID=7739 RepID=A0A9J7LYF2_BRAFL|nr:kelch-like protein 24 [Branchiostoma floridae]